MSDEEGQQSNPIDQSSPSPMQVAQIASHSMHGKYSVYFVSLYKFVSCMIILGYLLYIAEIFYICLVV